VPLQDSGSKRQSLRVKTWAEFKKLALRERPKSIVYVISQSVPARNLTSLQLIMHTQKAQYLFTDFKRQQTSTDRHTYTQRRKRQQVSRRQRREELPENRIEEGRPAGFLILDNLTT
jgi:hypothetical protein